MQVSRLEAEVKASKLAAGGTGPRKGGPGPCLSRTGSVDRNVEDQLLKDLQDSVERENDLKEQLSMAEEEPGESRKKLSRIEDENESLSGQLKRMSTKKSGTRSARGGSESGYSSDTYNAMTIRRLERDTSVDRLSTGSRESMQSTQSEWLPGEKKKSKGLLGKLKNAVKKDRNISEEREFGSGSDISSASVQSKQSTSSKMSTASKLIQRARSASKDRLNTAKAGGEKEKLTPAQHNAKFDQMFEKAGSETAPDIPGPTAPARPSASSTVPRPAASGASSTLPRTYRRF